MFNRATITRGFLLRFCEVIVKEEHKELVGGVASLAIVTLMVGPFSLLFVPDVVRNYKKAKEDRLVGENAGILDQQIADAEAQLQRDLARDAKRAEDRQRELERVARAQALEQSMREQRIEALRAEIVERAQERDRRTKQFQDWLDQKRVDRLKRAVRNGILPSNNPFVKGSNDGS